MEDGGKSTIGFNFGFGGAIFLVFLILKLTHVIDWSWWWITAPLWIPVSLSIIILVIIGIIAAVTNKN